MSKFTSRLSAPSSTDKHYFSSQNIFYSCGYGMPNCTAYAWGRLYEITGKRFTSLHGNAEDWWDAAKSSGMSTGQIPKLGSIICWRAGATHNGSDGCGHVAVVEEIKPNGDIVTSNSAWKGTMFYTQTLSKSNGYKYSDNRPLQGFIYCGIDFDEDEPEVKPEKPSTTTYSERDVCKLNSGAKWSNGATPCSWVYDKELTVKEVRGNELIVSKDGYNGGVTGVVYDYDVYKISDNEPEEEPSEPERPKRDSLDRGDIVHFTGDTHYTSSYSGGIGKPASPCEAEVTLISSSHSAVRRYHLIGDGVYGWVNDCDIAELN